MLKKFDSTVYFVADIHSAAQWYADILGTDVKYENSLYAYIQNVDVKIGFHPADTKSGTGVNGQTTYWRVAALQAAIDLLLAKGARLYRGPLQTSLNESACIVLDPFGNSLGLISDRA
jgi:predicted enzyme related to lactoylglutathione lyase